MGFKKEWLRTSLKAYKDKDTEKPYKIIALPAKKDPARGHGVICTVANTYYTCKWENENKSFSLVRVSAWTEILNGIAYNNYKFNFAVVPWKELPLSIILDGDYWVWYNIMNFSNKSFKYSFEVHGYPKEFCTNDLKTSLEFMNDAVSNIEEDVKSAEKKKNCFNLLKQSIDEIKRIYINDNKEFLQDYLIWTGV